MKRAVTLFAVIAALGLVFAGCKKKPAEKKGGDETATPAAMDEMDKMDPDMDTAEAMDKEPAMDVAEAMASGGDDFGKIGVAECDEYLKIYKCYLGKMPAAAQGPAKAAFQKTVDAYKKMASGPAKASLGKSCKMAMDAWKKAVSKMPQYADCFK